MVGGRSNESIRAPHGRVCRVHLREAITRGIEDGRVMLHPHGVCYRGGRCRTEDILDERAAHLMATILQQYGNEQQR
jgi:hypothetical protein